MNWSVGIDVSIILPVRNGAKMLDTALSAIYTQKEVSFEVIVMDGNSSDDTAAVVQKWLRPEDVYHCSADVGIYDAINKGIARAKGKWIYIQGADDGLAHANVLADMIAAAKPESRLLFGDVEYKRSESHWVKKRHVSSFGWKLLFRNTLHQQSAVYHHELFQSSVFDTRFKILADYAFHLKLYVSNNLDKGAVVKTHCVVARCGADGVSKKFTKALYQEEWRVRKACLPVIFLLPTLPIAPIKYWMKGRR